MTKVTPERLLAEYKELPLPEQQRFREMLVEESQPPPEKKRGRRVPPPVPSIDRSHEYNWLNEHAREYAGRWVALDGDRLIACGDKGAEVFAEAKAKGVDRPFLVHVEDPDGPPFAGF